MANLITESERKKLFTNIYKQLGFGVRQVQITDDQMDVLFCNALEDLSRIINDWLIDQQWGVVNGLNIEETDFTLAFATRDLNYVNTFTYAYSKQVGLGTILPSGDQWELKRDYVVLNPYQQIYQIPKGREVNEVLWVTPNTVTYDPLTPLGGWTAGNFGWTASIGSSVASFGYVQPVYSSMLASMDREMKNRVFKSDMSYRITANSDGSKNLHLYPIPDGKYMPKGFGSFYDTEVEGMKVWYFYYDKADMKKGTKPPSDIAVVTRPTDVPIDNLKWSKLNSASRTWIREYLTASAKYLLGMNRGTYSGAINIGDASVQMDYGFLLEDGRNEKEKLVTRLLERLENLSNTKQLERKALEAKYVNDVLKYSPSGIYVK